MIQSLGCPLDKAASKNMRLWVVLRLVSGVRVKPSEKHLHMIGAQYTLAAVAIFVFLLLRAHHLTPKA